MNYRHAFHAGNFADLVKHAALLRLLDRLLADGSPLTVVDTHAGAGRYDLTDEEQARSREAEAGVARLMSGANLPPGLAELAQRVRENNPGGAVRTYDGSPALVLGRLRPQDAFVACELRPDDHARLARLLGARGEARQADGYAAVIEIARKTRGRLLVLVDPPFERADDYVRIVETAAAVRKAKPDATLLIWTPLKDLETLDSFVRRLEEAGQGALINETRLRRLTDPMKLNGCVLAAIGAPEGFAGHLQTISDWVARTLGEPGGTAKTWLAGGDA
ncbi:MAG TPA: 23S rRNA (adenine(2030)-N(6))-methyltransferase RlmJ [Caulobacteraceae bacterium]|jgi:23S rRNA (adenine2030-N6)-methyltransferase